ncbi:MAG: hypothetical protein QM811_02765 [Pirellulales bacterium]
MGTPMRRADERHTEQHADANHSNGQRIDFFFRHCPLPDGERVPSLRVSRYPRAATRGKKIPSARATTFAKSRAGV